MKEAIGGLSLFQIVIILLLVFAGIMCLTINHSKAFGVKDEIINIIEKDNVSLSASNELSDGTLSKVAEYLQEAGYRITGECPSDKWVAYDRNGNRLSNNRNAAFCIRSVDVSKQYKDDAIAKCGQDKCEETGEEFPKMVYYEITLFYQLDIPVIKSVFNLKLNGSTKVLFG